MKVNGVAQGGGRGSLDTVGKVFKSKLALLQTKLLLVHDCDSHKQSETLDQKLYIRGIPQNPTNTKIRCGIENLLPESVARAEFYDEHTDEKGNEHRLINKRRMCNWVISQNDQSYYAAFSPLIAFIEELVKPR